MRRVKEGFLCMLGADPKKPAHPSEISEGVRRIMEIKREDKSRIKEHLHEQARLKPRHTWRTRRWIVLVAVNLLFVLSYWLDIQILEGALVASRFVGFHLIDLNSALQVMLAHKHIIVNLVIGTFTVFLLWVMLGGRSFCSWVCPYHLVSELTEMIHLALVARKIVTDHEFHRGTRTVFWVLFVVLAFVTGYTVFETLSPVGILSRALIYGPGLALAWVFLLLLFEVFWSRRAWCRYVCPIGLTYGVVGTISPLRISYHVKECFHEGDCRKLCLVPHVLDVTIKGRATDAKMALGPDCTRCGLCVDACPTGALQFEIKGLSKLL